MTEPTEAPCGHVPANPTRDLTLCWKCGDEIVCDQEKRVWRPLTPTEQTVKYETIDKLRDLFLSIHSAEYSQVLFERLQTRGVFAVRLAMGFLGRWIIVNGQDESLAWSGSRWVPHRNGFPTGPVQVSNWFTREEAKAYMSERFPESRQNEREETE